MNNFNEKIGTLHINVTVPQQPVAAAPKPTNKAPNSKQRRNKARRAQRAQLIREGLRIREDNAAGNNAGNVAGNADNNAGNDPAADPAHAEDDMDLVDL